MNEIAVTSIGATGMPARLRAAALQYVLVTPARDEAAFIEATIESVVAQSQLPLRWIIVSDGSTDDTDGIVRRYTARHPWIELLRVEASAGRDYASKARAFNTGAERLRDLHYDLIGNLDADVEVDEEFFAFLVDRFAELPALGMAGGRRIEGGTYYDYRFTNIEHVSGGCQLFRRVCFEGVGGYLPVTVGGIDCIAAMTARMKGWQTRTYVEKMYVHRRMMGTRGWRGWKAWFRLGEKDYAIGGHPLWQVARSLYQAASRPYVIGGALLLVGYGFQLARRSPRPVAPELVRFYRREQVYRLRRAARLLRPVGRSVAPTGELSLIESVGRLERWVESHDYRGYEPFDGLSSPVRSLTFGSLSLERVLQQIGRQSPVNFRPLLGIKPLDSTKGRGYMAWGYLARFQLTGKEPYRQKAIACLEWLARAATAAPPEYAWGNHFDYASRTGRYAKQEPITVWTALIGEAFLDAFEQLGIERYLDVAKGVCTWIAKLPRERAVPGACLSYLADRQASIHNANILGAAMLARCARHTRNAEWLEVARTAVDYTCARQRPDGSWYYGEDPMYRWIDSFHTGYVLDGIKRYADSTGDQSFRPHLDRGLRYFVDRFVEPDGRPAYYHDRVFPIDIQCAAQAIETLATFSTEDPAALRMATTVARWTIRNMQDPTGYFYYRRYPLLVARIPMLHWGQATMYRALALLLLKNGGAGPRSGAA